MTDKLIISIQCTVEIYKISIYIHGKTERSGSLICIHGIYRYIYIYIHGIQGVFCGPPNMVPLGLQSSSSNI